VWAWVENVNKMSSAKREQLSLSKVFSSPHTRSTVLEPLRTGNALEWYDGVRMNLSLYVCVFMSMPV
jgi:hypothetical protein